MSDRAGEQTAAWHRCVGALERGIKACGCSLTWVGNGVLRKRNELEYRRRGGVGKAGVRRPRGQLQIQRDQGRCYSTVRGRDRI